MPDSKAANKTDHISAYLPADLVEALRNEGERTGVKLKRIIANALAEHLNVKLEPVSRQRKTS